MRCARMRHNEAQHSEPLLRRVIVGENRVGIKCNTVQPCGTVVQLVLLTFGFYNSENTTAINRKIRLVVNVVSTLAERVTAGRHFLARTEHS